MTIDVLGGLRVGGPGGDAGPTAPKQRQLLGLLVLRADEVVPAATCMRELWHDHPPRSAATTLQTYVMHLRRVLVHADVSARVVTCERGYRLRVDPLDTDLGVVRARVREGEERAAADDPTRAARSWREALALWRGAVLADVRTGPVAQQIAGHLDQWRLLLVERYLEAELRCGRHRQVVPTATALAGRHPLSEPIHASLISALHRSGRQADAVRVYERLAAALRRDLGVPPSEPLRRLHQAVRTGAAWLDPPPPAAPVLCLDALSALDAGRRPFLVPTPPGGTS
ncbi:AfsR/SARP family transcriptional regulator [Micromonospora sp. NPDC002389]|uniref:AfsR/SARP family transcriptional regulator n=1 Tax=Micromonospora sp. NPDC002389 TaxID=3154272 RepID=UPI00332FEE8C